MTVFKEIWDFFKRHWLHFLLAPPGAILCTALHEAAHALAVLLQGGRVLEFAWMPGGGRWGYIRFLFPPGGGQSREAVSIAPYVLWLSMMLLTALLAWRWPQPRPSIAATLFIWCFVVPLGDIANTALPYWLGWENDFTAAFGVASLWSRSGIILFGAAATISGRWVEQRLYGAKSISWAAYMLLALSGLLLVGVLNILIDFL